MLTASILQNVPLHEHDSLVDIRAIPVSGCSEWADAISAQSCLCQFLSNYTEEESAPAVFAWLTSTGAAHAIFGLATAKVSQHMQVLPQALKGALDGARSSALQVSLSLQNVVLTPALCFCLSTTHSSAVSFELAQLERRRREPFISRHVSSANFGCCGCFTIPAPSRFTRSPRAVDYCRLWRFSRRGRARIQACSVARLHGDGRDAVQVQQRHP